MNEPISNWLQPLAADGAEGFAAIRGISLNVSGLTVRIENAGDE